MEVTDDNFFIEEPQKLRNNFFNKDKSMQLVELLNKTRHNDNASPMNHISANNTTSISTRASSKRAQQQQQQQQQQQPQATLYSPSTCRLTYTKKAQLLHKLPLQLNDAQDATNFVVDQAKPTSFIDMLEVLCMAAYKGDDLGLAKRALDALLSASKSGCCFLEKYLVMLLNFCTRQRTVSDETVKIKIEELSRRALLVEFDRQQMTENLRRPDYKLNSVKQIVRLLERVQSLLDFWEHKAIDWLYVILDAYFVELATTDEADLILEQICTRIHFQCTLLREVESTKSLLNTLYEYQQLCCNSETSNTVIASVNRFRHKRPYYSIETIEI